MSNTLILYQTEKGLTLTRPVDLSIPLMELARGTTPAGVPFIFVDESELPDFEYFDAWTADFSEPDGYGIGPEAWAIERQNMSNVVINDPTQAVLDAAKENAKRYNDATTRLNSFFSDQSPEDNQ